MQPVNKTLVPLHHAIEIRDQSFPMPPFIELLQAYGRPRLRRHGRMAGLMDLTADFVYCRLHGSQELYVHAYEGPEFLCISIIKTKCAPEWMLKCSGLA